MKMRSGFVSNSSSSSFVCVLAKADHEKVIAQLSATSSDIIQKYVQEGQIGDLEVVAYGSLSVHDFTQFSGDIGWSGDMNVDSEDFATAESDYYIAVHDLGIKTFIMQFEG